MTGKRKDLDALLASVDDADDDERDDEAHVTADAARSRKRSRQEEKSNDSNDTTVSTRNNVDSDALTQALQALNAAFVASLQAQLKCDPASYLTPLTRAYEEDVKALLQRYAAISETVTNAIEMLHAELDEEETTASAVEFVASSDATTMGERELDEGEVYFGASLDLQAFSASSRQVLSVEFEANGFLANRDTYGASSIWNDPALLRARLPPDAFDVHSLLVPSKGVMEVWRGTYQLQPVVIKRLAREHQTLLNAIAFAQHLSTIVSLEHPNIVRLVGIAWTKAADLHVATEYMDRGDLDALLRTPDVVELWTWAEKCHIAIQTADALAYLHNHTRRAAPCPLTSRKVLVDASGTAKLQLTTASPTPATPWMAPEVLRGETRSPRSDTYAFGILLCELDTPLASESSTATLSDACPEALASLARQCLSVDPSQRPEAERVAYALREIVKNEL